MRVPPLRVVLCIFGVVPRAIRVTWPAINARIVQVLRDQNMLVHVTVFTNDVGERLVDGCRTEQADVHLVPYSVLEIHPQAEADIVINESCTPTLDICPMLFIQRLPLEQRRNALRQMYMEAVVGRFLNRSNSSFDAAVVIGGDYYPLHNVSANDVLEAANRTHTMFISRTSPSGGFTNGFYIGHLHAVSRVMSRADIYFQDRLLRTRRGYEAHLAAAFAHFSIKEKYTDFLFAKVRASGMFAGYTWPHLCNRYQQIKAGLSPTGAAWLHETLEIIAAKMRLPAIEGLELQSNCLTKRPAVSFLLTERDRQDPPDELYSSPHTCRGSACKATAIADQRRCMTYANGSTREEGRPSLQTESDADPRDHTLRVYRRDMPAFDEAEHECIYTPSSLEVAWADVWAQWEIQRTPVTQAVLCEASSRLGAPQRPRDASMFTCGSSQVEIEPLVGILRNPRVPCEDRSLSAVLNQSYLWLDVLPPLNPGSHAYLLDMGASTWMGGGPGEREVGASGTSFIVDRFAQLGLAFDRILAWEATPHSGSEIWSSVPVEIQARMSYYNVPISDNENQSSYPWRHLLELAAPRDFVVVKLDVDNPVIEASLIHQLMQERAISSRVDVLLWEPHWRSASKISRLACADPLQLCIVPGFHRNARHPSPLHTYLSETVKTFAELRKLGVLAHAWY
jgi:hypothetical protein